MKKTLSQLKSIENQARSLNERINNEQRVYEAELKERRQLGLTGEAGRQHYNEWMSAHHMEHLMLK